MSMEKYRSSDIIFGTREKILEIRENLSLLEALTSTTNKDVKKVIYRIIRDYKRKDEKFICDLLNNRSKMQDIIDYLKSGYLYSPTDYIGTSELEKDDNGDYRFKDSEFNQFVSITNQNRFKEIIDEIQSSDYYDELAYRKIRKDEKKYYEFIRIGYDGIYVSSVLKDKRLGNLVYDPRFDIITANALYGIIPHKITEKEVKELLSAEVDGSSLSDYQRSLIDNSEAAKKEIIIDDCSEKDYNEIYNLFKDRIQIKLYRLGENKGPGYARQYGLNKSKSDYIIFMDSDDCFYDYSSAEYLQQCIDNEEFDVGVGKLAEYHCNKIYEYTVGFDVLHAKVYRRSFLKLNNIIFPDMYNSEDLSFNNLVSFISTTPFNIVLYEESDSEANNYKSCFILLI